MMISSLRASRPGLATIALSIVVSGAVLAVGWAAIAAHLGYAQPWAELLGRKGDLFADFFTVLASFPASDHTVFDSVFGLFDVHVALPDPNPYLGVGGLLADPYLGLEDGPTGPILTHLHLAPLTMAFCQLALRAMAATGGVGLFGACYAALVAYWTKVAVSWAGGWRRGTVWVAIGLFSYPAILMVTRGNIYAGVAGIMLVHAMLLAARRRSPVLAVVLLAVAVNIRPNAILFALPILLFYWSSIRRVLPIFVATGGGIFLASIAVANRLYPDYDFENFRVGLEVYYETYVVGDEGLGLSSTLYGGVKFLIGYHPGLDLAAVALSGVLLALGAWAWLSGRLSDAAFLFLTATVYCLSASVLSNYHLLVFLAPVMVAADQADGRLPGRWGDRIAIAACCLILIPKNAFFRGDLSYQTVLNPAILLIGAIVVLTLTLRQSGVPWAARLRSTLPAEAA